MTQMFRQFTGTALATSLTLTGIAVPTAAARADEKYEITCESGGYGEQFCAAPNRKVKLVDDFSGRCDRDQTWRYDERGIYVRNGCAARFRVTRDGYASYPGQYPGQNGGQYPDQYPNSDGRYDKKDNTGTVVAAVALGAGLLWLISQSGKNKKHAPAETSSGSNGGGTGGDWTNPDGDRARNDPLAGLSSRDRRAVDICSREVERDVRAKGGSDITLDRLGGVTGGSSRQTVAGDWSARFGSKGVKTRAVTCTVENDRVTDYRLG
jgi:hypothetical protein